MGGAFCAHSPGCYCLAVLVSPRSLCQLSVVEPPIVSRLISPSSSFSFLSLSTCSCSRPSCSCHSPSFRCDRLLYHQVLYGLRMLLCPCIPAHVVADGVNLCELHTG